MSKSQVNFRLPDELIAALKDRAESEGVTSTELAIRLLEAGLGLSSPENKSADSRIEERISVQLTLLQKQLDQRIEERIENALAPIQLQVVQLNQSVEGRIATRLTDHLAPLQGQVLELTRCIADHISTQLEPLQKQLEQIEQRIEEHIHPVIQKEVDAVLGEFYASAAESSSQAEVKGLRSHLVVASPEGLVDSREKAAMGSGLLEPLPDKIDNGGWLSLKEAYKLAQEYGYAGSKTGFMQLRDATFRKLGFEVDRSRRISGGKQNSRWLRFLNPT